MTTTAPRPVDAADQASHFFIITLDLSGTPVTAQGGFNPGPDQTRHQAYEQIYRSTLANFPDYRQLPVLFFSIERNTI